MKSHTMLYRFILNLVLLFVCMISFSQSKLGEVACVYVTTPDLDSSVAMYGQLGFPKTASNTFPVPWAQVSDGSLLIMMRKDPVSYIGLTYYVTDIDNVAARLEKEGIEFVQKPKEGDPIKRYYIKTPDGFNIMLASNLGAFSQPAGLTILTMNTEDFQQSDKSKINQFVAFGEFCNPALYLNIQFETWNKL